MDDVCRLCSSKNELINIFRTHNLSHMIHEASGVQILPTDEISQKVCLQCCTLAGRIYQYRQRSIKNDQELSVELEKRKKLELLKIAFNKKDSFTTSSSSSGSSISVSSGSTKSHDTSQNKRLPIRKKTIKFHPSIVKMKKENPNLKFPPLQPDSHYQPYITLLTNEVSDYYRNKKSRGDALFQDDESLIEKVQPVGSENLASNTLEDEEEEIIDFVNVPEEQIVNKNIVDKENEQKRKETQCETIEKKVMEKNKNNKEVKRKKCDEINRSRDVPSKQIKLVSLSTEVEKSKAIESNTSNKEIQDGSSEETNIQKTVNIIAFEKVKSSEVEGIKKKSTVEQNTSKNQETIKLTEHKTSKQTDKPEEATRTVVTENLESALQEKNKIQTDKDEVNIVQVTGKPGDGEIVQENNCDDLIRELDDTIMAIEQQQLNSSFEVVTVNRQNNSKETCAIVSQKVVASNESSLIEKRGTELDDISTKKRNIDVLESTQTSSSKKPRTTGPQDEPNSDNLRNKCETLQSTKTSSSKKPKTAIPHDDSNSDNLQNKCEALQSTKTSSSMKPKTITPHDHPNSDNLQNKFEALQSTKTSSSKKPKTITPHDDPNSDILQNKCEALQSTKTSSSMKPKTITPHDDPNSDILQNRCEALQSTKTSSSKKPKTITPHDDSNSDNLPNKCEALQSTKTSSSKKPKNTTPHDDSNSNVLRKQCETSPVRVVLEKLICSSEGASNEIQPSSSSTPQYPAIKRTLFSKEGDNVSPAQSKSSVGYAHETGSSKQIASSSGKEKLHEKANIHQKQNKETSGQIIQKSKEAIIDFNLLREVLKEKLMGGPVVENPEKDKSNKNDNTNEAHTSKADNVNNVPSSSYSSNTNQSVSPKNDSQKVDFVKSLNLMPCTEKGGETCTSDILKVRFVKFCCKYCNANHSTLKSLRNHERKYHTSCAFCNYNSETLDDRTKHMLFYCARRKIKIPRVILPKVDKQKEIVSKYPNCFSSINSENESTSNPNAEEHIEAEDGEFGNSEAGDERGPKFNILHYNDVISKMNVKNPNILQEVRNEVKERNVHTIETVIIDPLCCEFYVKDLALDLHFQKVKVDLKYGKRLGFRYEQSKYLPVATPKQDRWHNELVTYPLKDMETLQQAPTGSNENKQQRKRESMKEHIERLLSSEKNKKPPPKESVLQNLLETQSVNQQAIKDKKLTHNVEETVTVPPKPTQETNGNGNQPMRNTTPVNFNVKNDSLLLQSLKTPDSKSPQQKTDVSSDMSSEPKSSGNGIMASQQKSTASSTNATPQQKPNLNSSSMPPRQTSNINNTTPPKRKTNITNEKLPQPNATAQKQRTEKNRTETSNTGGQRTSGAKQIINSKPAISSPPFPSPPFQKKVNFEIKVLPQKTSVDKQTVQNNRNGEPSIVSKPNVGGTTSQQSNLQKDLLQSMKNGTPSSRSNTDRRLSDYMGKQKSSQTGVDKRLSDYIDKRIKTQTSTNKNVFSTRVGSKHEMSNSDTHRPPSFRTPNSTSTSNSTRGGHILSQKQTYSSSPQTSTTRSQPRLSNSSTFNSTSRGHISQNQTYSSPQTSTTRSQPALLNSSILNSTSGGHMFSQNQTYSSPQTSTTQNRSILLNSSASNNTSGGHTLAQNQTYSSPQTSTALNESTLLNSLTSNNTSAEYTLAQNQTYSSTQTSATRGQPTLLNFAGNLQALTAKLFPFLVNGHNFLLVPQHQQHVIPIQTGQNANIIINGQNVSLNPSLQIPNTTVISSMQTVSAPTVTHSNYNRPTPDGTRQASVFVSSSNINNRPTPTQTRPVLNSDAPSNRSDRSAPRIKVKDFRDLL